MFITGSHYSVTEQLPWMLQLQALLHDAVLERQPPIRCIGICFGCQVRVCLETDKGKELNILGLACDMAMPL